MPIPEGQLVVRCSYCDLRSFVRGERGLRRYQIPLRVERESAVLVMDRFLARNWAIARDAARNARLEETLLVYLPFWTIWGRVAAWAFGEKKVGDRDSSRYEPREIRIVQEMTWNGAACDVGEFGVTQVALDGQEIEPYDPEALHASALVFEPVGSFSQAKETAEHRFWKQVHRKVNLDRISQLFMRTFRRRYGLVYYPMWVLRYIYRERSFQVVADGYSGKVLYGKAPGNTLYRAAVLVLGMALGALVAVDASAFVFSQSGSGDGEGAFSFGLILILAGFAIMGVAYRAFRYGEQYEYRSSRRTVIPGVENPLEMISTTVGSMKVREIEEWINRLS